MGFFRVIGGIILAVLAIGLAGAIFQTGYLAGAAGTGTSVAGPGYAWGWGWGWGGGLFNLLGLILFVVLFFAILRAVVGGHRHDRGLGHGGYRGGWDRAGYGDEPRPDHFAAWQDRARQVHDEWHRHQDAAPASAPDRPAGTGGTGSASAGPGVPPAGADRP